jgi:L-threonylcarbamoyladenylate synthase
VITEILPGSAAGIGRAAHALRSGLTVAFPTETVYGLGADAGNPAAVSAVFAAKGRPADHPLIVHLPAGSDPAEWSSAGGERLAVARQLAQAFWPGPLTLVLPRSERILPLVTGGQPTVALRVPASDTALALLEAAGLPLVGPSANRFGRISPTSAQHVLQELAGRVPFILDGGSCTVGLESTILDLSGFGLRILRPGAVSAQQLEAVLGLPVNSGAAGADAPRTPGSLASHYAPAARTLLLGGGSFSGFIAGAADGGAGTGVISLQPAPAGFRGAWRQLPAEPAGYSQRLYATLRELDALSKVIVIERPPGEAGWEAVNDRLQRAAA